MKKFLSFSVLAIFAVAFSAFTTSKEPLPDLCIEEVKVVCTAQRWLVFQVANVGDAKSTATILRIRPEDGDDPTQRCIQQAVKNIPILAPGQVFKLRVPLKTSEGCDCKATLKFTLDIDHKNYIQEKSEVNNNKKFAIGG